MRKLLIVLVIIGAIAYAIASAAVNSVSHAVATHTSQLEEI